MIEVAVAGVGMTAFGRFPDRRIDAMGADAVAEALADAGVSAADVDAVWCGNVLGGGAAGQRSISATAIEGVPVQNIENACASGSHAFAEAFAAVRDGRVRVALVIGVESATTAFDGGLITLDRDDEPTRLGLNLPGIYAMNASRYLAEYDADPRALAAVSVKNHAAGVNNPRARFREAVTLDEVLDSKPIAEPLTLLQCCANADGAAALVLMPTADARADAIRVLGCGVASGYRIDRGYDLSRSRITAAAGDRAFADAGIDRSRVDLAEVHDAFTIGELIALESLGLAERGRAWRMTLDGETSPGGVLPVNTSGGLLSRGHAVGASGVAQVVELSRQLQGRSENPAPGAEVALAHTVGGGVATHDGIASVVGLLARPEVVR
ncbi:MAG TPA: thiolase family protein [Agromyces sp.]|nr:thiolase family protein [Agromyces sp.]